MRGIMFTELLFNRALAGQKDMTRRSGGFEAVNGTKKEPLNPDDATFDDSYYRIGFEGYCKARFTFPDKEPVLCKSHYKIREYLYIKEPTFYMPETNSLYYKYQPTDSVMQTGWDNKMFMGRDRARYFIQITGISIDRLNDISIRDCIREGVPMLGHRKASNARYKIEHPGMRINEKTQFFSIYRVANNIPAGKVLPNIWVFVYTFKLITDPEEINKLKEYGKI